jgi:hypothetical protein
MSTRMSSDPSIARDRRDVRTSLSLIFRLGTRKPVTDEGVYRDLGFRLLFTISDQRLPAVTGYVKVWGL